MSSANYIIPNCTPKNNNTQIKDSDGNPVLEKINSIGDFLWDMVDSKAKLEKLTIQVGEGVIVMAILKQIILMGMKEILVIETDAVAGPVGLALMAVQVLGLIFDIWDPQGYDVVFDNDTLKNMSNKLTNKTIQTMKENCIKWPHEINWKPNMPPIVINCLEKQDKVENVNEQDCKKKNPFQYSTIYNCKIGNTTHEMTFAQCSKNGGTVEDFAYCAKNIYDNTINAKKPSDCTNKNLVPVQGMCFYPDLQNCKVSDTQLKNWHLHMNNLTNYIVAWIKESRKQNKNILNTNPPTNDKVKTIIHGHHTDIINGKLSNKVQTLKEYLESERDKSIKEKIEDAPQKIKIELFLILLFILIISSLLILLL